MHSLPGNKLGRARSREVPSVLAFGWGSTYGDIQIDLTQTVELSDVTIRTFCLKKANSRAERTVNLFHYTVWPDHGVPSCSTSLLTFVRKESGANPSDAGPMVSWKM